MILKSGKTGRKIGLETKMVYKAQHYEQDGLFQKNIKDYSLRHKNNSNLPINGCSVYTNECFHNSV